MHCSKRKRTSVRAVWKRCVISEWKEKFQRCQIDSINELKTKLTNQRISAWWVAVVNGTFDGRDTFASDNKECLVHHLTCRFYHLRIKVNKNCYHQQWSGSGFIFRAFRFPLLSRKSFVKRRERERRERKGKGKALKDTRVFVEWKRSQQQSGLAEINSFLHSVARGSSNSSDA